MDMDACIDMLSQFGIDLQCMQQQELGPLGDLFTLVVDKTSYLGMALSSNGTLNLSQFSRLLLYATLRQRGLGDAHAQHMVTFFQNDKGYPIPRFPLSRFSPGATVVLDKFYPIEFSSTFDDLMNLDKLTLKVLPERKGGLRKYHEYEMNSKAHHNATVCRRYSDFELFRSLLKKRYPYRAIPRLPENTITSVFWGGPKDDQKRHRALQQFINVVSRHPALHNDELVMIFITYSFENVTAQLNSAYTTELGELDEYFVNPFLRNIDEFCWFLREPPAHVVATIKQARKEFTELQKFLIRQKETVFHLLESKDSRKGLDMIGKNLAALGSSFYFELSECENWKELQTIFRGKQEVFSELATKSKEEQKRFGDLEDSIELLCELEILVQAFLDVAKCDTTGQQLTARKNSPVFLKISKTCEWLSDPASSLIARSNFAVFCLYNEMKLVIASLPLFLASVEKIEVAFSSEKTSAGVGPDTCPSYAQANPIPAAAVAAFQEREEPFLVLDYQIPAGAVAASPEGDEPSQPNDDDQPPVYVQPRMRHKAIVPVPKPRVSSPYGKSAKPISSSPSVGLVDQTAHDPTPSYTPAIYPDIHSQHVPLPQRWKTCSQVPSCMKWVAPGATKCALGHAQH